MPKDTNGLRGANPILHSTLDAPGDTPCPLPQAGEGRGPGGEERAFKETELGPIPVGWEVVRLGDVFEIQQGKALSRKHQQGVSPYPFLRTANVRWGRIDLSSVDEMDFTGKEVEKLALKPGDLLVCEGGEIGRTAIWQLEAGTYCYQNHLHRLRTNREDISPLFYMYWMQAAFLLLNLYHGAGVQTTIANLSRSRLSQFLLPKPPLPEQRRIAHVLRTIQRAIAAQDKLIAAARELKRSLMQHLFTYGPVPLDQADQVPLKETEIGPVPEHWEVVRLGDLAQTTSGGTPSRKNLDYFGGNIPWVKSGELNDSIIRGAEEYITDKGLKNSSAKIFPSGTLLIAMYGATVGKTGILGIQAATNQAICAIFPRDDAFLPKFLMYWLIFRRRDLLKERYGGAQPNISQTLIRSFLIPHPPLSEQHQIASKLSVVDRKIEAEERRKAALQALFKAMLHLLMTGKVRVRNVKFEG